MLSTLHPSGAPLSVCPTCDVELSQPTARCPRCGGAAISVRSNVETRLGLVLAGRYHIRAVLGAGGMGTVYRATEQPGGREVAVKLIHEHCRRDRMWLRRFLREAHLATQLHHPHTVAVLDFGQTEGGDLYLVMELLGGRTLAEAMASEGAFSRVRTARLGMQLCDALAVAHARRIVHRDLKPANVMLLDPAPGGDDFAKILDFGLAKLLGADETEATQTGHLLGTPRYLAPEIFFGDAPGAASDLYSLGVLLAEAHLGRRLFTSEALGGLQLEKARLVLPDAPAMDVHLRDVLERMLEPNPAARVADAATVRAWLAACAEETPGARLGAARRQVVETPRTLSLETSGVRRARWRGRAGLAVAALAIAVVAAAVATLALRRRGTEAAAVATEGPAAQVVSLPDPELVDSAAPSADDEPGPLLEARLHLVTRHGDGEAEVAELAATLPVLDARYRERGVRFVFDAEADHERVAAGAAATPAPGAIMIDVAAPGATATTISAAVAAQLGSDAASARTALAALARAPDRRYDAIFVRPAWPMAQVHRLGLTRAELVERDAALALPGFHLVALRGFAAGGGERRYDAVWQLGAPSTELGFDLPFTAFRDAQGTRNAAGQKLVAFEVHDVVPGDLDHRLYDAVWARTAISQNLRFGWARRDVRVLADELKPLGYVLVELHAYDIGEGKLRYDILFSRTWHDSVYQLGWRRDRLEARDAELEPQHWGLVTLHGFEQAPTRVRYDAVWETISKATPQVSLLGYDAGALARKWDALTRAGYVLKSWSVRAAPPR